MSNDEWTQNIRKTLRQNSPNISNEEIELFLSSSNYWGSENYRTAAKWTKTTQQLLKKPTCLPRVLVFVNLNGLLQDIPKFLKDKANVFSTFGITDDNAAAEFISKNTDSLIKAHLKLLWEVNKTSSLIRSKVSEEDMFILGFLRHRYCHPTLSDYSVKIKGSLKTSKIKPDKWKILLNLGSKTKEDEFKNSIIKKLKPILKTIEHLETQLDQLSK